MKKLFSWEKKNVYKNENKSNKWCEHFLISLITEEFIIQTNEKSWFFKYTQKSIEWLIK